MEILETFTVTYKITILLHNITKLLLSYMLHHKIRYLEGKGKWCKYLPAFTWTKLYMRHKYFVQLIFTVININNPCMRPQTAPQDASSGLRAQARLSCRFNFNQIQSVFQVPQHLVITSIFHSGWERLIAQVSAQIYISSNSRKIWANSWERI